MNLPSDLANESVKQNKAQQDHCEFQNTGYKNKILRAFRERKTHMYISYKRQRTELTSGFTKQLWKLTENEEIPSK